VKLSMDSWHYRLCRQVFTYPSRNLCIYFWQVPISAITMCACFFVAVGMLLMGAGTLLLPVLPYLIPTPYGLTIAMGVLSLVVWAMAFDTINKVYRHKSWNVTLFKIQSRRVPKPKKQILLLSYIKAKKAKVCPIIEFERS